jgi:hypothetical protein
MQTFTRAEYLSLPEKMKESNEIRSLSIKPEVLLIVVDSVSLPLKNSVFRSGIDK